MAIGVRCVDMSYSLSGYMANVSITFELFDDQITDENGVPKTLDSKTISVTQNILDVNAKENLRQKVLNELQKYLEKAKTNIGTLLSNFGTIDPDQILTNLKNDIEQEVPNVISNVFGG